MKDTRMIEVTSYAPGSFCWAELSTNNSDSAKQFYSKLLGWTISDVPMGEGQFYTMFKINGKDVAALYQQGEQEKGVYPHWNAYVAVANADEVAKKAQSLGAQLLAEPFDVMDTGRMAVIQDPDGAVIHIWQAGKHIGATLANQPGTLSWNELMAKDDVKARAFYSELFGWTANIQKLPTGGEYTVFMKNDNTPAGGLMKITPEMGPVPPHWATYFAVADCDQSVAEAVTLGGKVIVPATDIKDVGRFSVLQDPQGAYFSIIRLDNPNG